MPDKRTPDMKRLIEAIRSLQEIHQNAGKDLLEESLATGTMTRFLFEADEEAAEASIKEALAAANEEINQLAKTGETLNNSTAIAAVVGKLRTNIAKIALAPDKKQGFLGFLGKTVKQITWIGNGVATVSAEVHDAVEAVNTALETLQVPKDAKVPIKDLVKAEEERTNISPDDFKSGIEKKISKTGASGGFFGALIKGLLGGAKLGTPVDLNSSKFADELMSCTREQIEAYLASPAGKEDPGDPNSSDVDDKIKQIPTEAEVDMDDAIEAADKPPEPPKKLKSADLGKMSDEEMKDAVNSTARQFGAREDIVERHLQAPYPESQLIAERWNRMAGLEVHNEED